MRFRLFAVQNEAFFGEPILQFYLYIRLFIRDFVIRCPKQQECMYRELRGTSVCLLHLVSTVKAG
jgi:hypothetical protein